MASSLFSCAPKKSLSLESRVFRIRRAHANPSYGRRYSSQHARRLLSRLEADVTMSPGFLVPAVLPRVQLYGEHGAHQSQHATGRTRRRDPRPGRRYQIHEMAQFRSRVRQHVRKKFKNGAQGISEDPEARRPSRLRVSWSHTCPGEDCIESLCDLDVEPVLEDLVPCASTGLSIGAFLDCRITGLGSYALPSLRLIDTLHISALNGGLDQSWIFLAKLLVDIG